MASVAEKLQKDYAEDWNNVSGCFPRLPCTCLTSPPTARYNCIAWAADQTDVWWWPSSFPQPGCYWPPNAPRNNSLTSFLSAYGTLGYVPIGAGDIDNYQRVIAITGQDGKVLHAMKRLPDGRWSSKLGKSFDIVHGLNELDGNTYGTVIGFMGKELKK